MAGETPDGRRADAARSSGYDRDVVRVTPSRLESPVLVNKMCHCLHGAEDIIVRVEVRARSSSVRGPPAE
jgi:hypothetical protein